MPFWHFPLGSRGSHKKAPSLMAFMDEEESTTRLLNALDSLPVVTGKGKVKTLPVSKISRSTLVGVQF